MESYKSLAEWRKAKPKEAAKAYRNGWVNELCKVKGWSTLVGKPKGYWTLEICKGEAQKYLTKTDWKIGSPSSFNAAVRNRWVYQCGEHMVNNRRPNGYWTLEKCKEKASQYNLKTKWEKGHLASYTAARKKGWLDECCYHMVEGRKNFEYWTLERCKEKAREYSTRTEWPKGHTSSYESARINGWLDECCDHMIEFKKPSGYWTLEKCLGKAIKYSSKSEWQKGHLSSYQAASRNGWIDECGEHMGELRKPNGYWTLERCKDEANKFTLRTQWSNADNSSYAAANKNGWLDECCGHMIEIQKPSGYWNRERCKEDAKKYLTRREWAINNGTPYYAAIRNGWLDECCAHMVELRKPDRYWTLELCSQEAEKYKTKGEWRQGSGASYKAAYKNDWLNEIYEIKGWKKSLKRIHDSVAK